MKQNAMILQHLLRLITLSHLSHIPIFRTLWGAGVVNLAPPDFSAMPQMDQWRSTAPTSALRVTTAWMWLSMPLSTPVPAERSTTRQVRGIFIYCNIFTSKKTRLHHQQLKLLNNGGKHSKQWTYLFKYFIFSVVVMWSFYSSGV